MPLFTTKYLGVEYDESNFLQSSCRPEGQSYVRHVQLPGASDTLAQQAFLGWSEYDEVLGNPNLRRFEPERHPRYPWAVARSFEFVRELGEPGHNPGLGDSLEYASAEYAVTYEAGTEDLAGVRFLADGERPPGVVGELWRYVRRHVDYEAHNVPVGRNELEFVATNGGGGHDVVPNPGVVLQREATLRYWFYQVPVEFDGQTPVLPGALEGNINRCVEHTNSTGFDTVYGADTLLCLEPKRVLRVMSNGELAMDLLYTFAKRGSGVGVAADAPSSSPDFTRIMRADGQYWKVRRRSNPTQGIYPRADLSYLFRFDAMP